MIVFALILSVMLIPSGAAPSWNGDANGDGQITLDDVLVMLRHIAAWDIDIDPLADFDENGKIDLIDVTYVLKYIAKWNVAPDSLLEAQYGVNAVDFDVPMPVTTETVNGSQFGFNTESSDNTDAWIAAIAYLKDHPGTKLEIENGVYKMAGNKYIGFSGLNNCIIDGGGSTFLYANRNFFSVSSSDLLAVQNLTIDWDYETAGFPTTSVVRVLDRSKTDDPKYDSITYEFYLVDDASYAMTQPWDSMLHMDPDRLTVGTVDGKGDKFYVGNLHKNLEQISPNVITALVESIYDYEAGDIWLIRHYNYSGAAFVQSSGTNITYRDITVHSGPGGGIYLQNAGTHHVRIDGITIGLNPENADHIRMSVTADALNFKNTGGYIIVENCDVGFQGDDGINIHTTPGAVEFAYDNKLEMVVRNGNNFYVGCEIGFHKAENYEETDFTAVITGYQLMESMEFGQRYMVTLDRDVPPEIEENWIAHNIDNNGEYYIIRNNYFHENRARGLLLGSPNGLVENNRLYRIQSAAVNICIDHGSQWIEGTGVNNLIVRNNTFEECNLIGKDAYINISAGSSYSSVNMIAGECFKDILFSGNTFINPKSEILAARSIDRFAFVNNTIKNPDNLTSYLEPDKYFHNRGKLELRGFNLKNVTIAHNTWEASPYIPEDINEVEINDRIRDQVLSEYGNYIK